MGEAWVISALDSNPTAIINGSFQGLTLKEFYERNKNLCWIILVSASK